MNKKTQTKVFVLIFALHVLYPGLDNECMLVVQLRLMKKEIIKLFNTYKQLLEYMRSCLGSFCK